MFTWSCRRSLNGINILAPFFNSTKSHPLGNAICFRFRRPTSICVQYGDLSRSKLNIKLEIIGFNLASANKIGWIFFITCQEQSDRTWSRFRRPAAGVAIVMLTTTVIKGFDKNWDYLQKSWNFREETTRIWKLLLNHINKSWYYSYN